MLGKSHQISERKTFYKSNFYYALDAPNENTKVLKIFWKYIILINEMCFKTQNKIKY